MPNIFKKLIKKIKGNNTDEVSYENNLKVLSELNDDGESDDSPNSDNSGDSTVFTKENLEEANSKDIIQLSDTVSEQTKEAIDSVETPKDAEKIQKSLEKALKNIKNKMKGMPSKVSKKLKPLADSISKSIEAAGRKAKELKDTAKDIASITKLNLKETIKNSRTYQATKIGIKNPFSTKTKNLPVGEDSELKAYREIAKCFKNFESVGLRASVLAKETKDSVKKIIEIGAEINKLNDKSSKTKGKARETIETKIVNLTAKQSPLMRTIRANYGDLEMYVSFMNSYLSEVRKMHRDQQNLNMLAKNQYNH